MRIPRGLVVTHYFPDAGCGGASEEVREGPGGSLGGQLW